MKMTPEHYEKLKAMMMPMADRVPGHRLSLIADPRVKDMEMRVRWDWFWASKPGDFVTKELYEYLDDRHIDTALKQIMKEIGQ